MRAPPPPRCPRRAPRRSGIAPARPSPRPRLAQRGFGRREPFGVGGGRRRSLPLLMHRLPVPNSDSISRFSCAAFAARNCWLCSARSCSVAGATRSAFASCRAASSAASSSARWLSRRRPRGAPPPPRRRAPACSSARADSSARRARRRRRRRTRRRGPPRARRRWAWWWRWRRPPAPTATATSRPPDGVDPAGPGGYDGHDCHGCGDAMEEGVVSPAAPRWVPPTGRGVETDGEPPAPPAGSISATAFWKAPCRIVSRSSSSFASGELEPCFRITQCFWSASSRETSASSAGDGPRSARPPTTP